MRITSGVALGVFSWPVRLGLLWVAVLVSAFLWGAALSRFGGSLLVELLVSVGTKVRAVPRTLRGPVVAGLVRAICRGAFSARLGGTRFGESLVSAGMKVRDQPRTLRGSVVAGLVQAVCGGAAWRIFDAWGLEFALEGFIEN